MRTCLTLCLLPFFGASAFTMPTSALHGSANPMRMTTPFARPLSSLKALPEDRGVTRSIVLEKGPGSPSTSSTRILPALGSGLLTWMAAAQASVADSPDWGIFEGRTGSLLHPIMMGSLLLYSIYTALLGFQWRRQRTIGDEIKALQKSLPELQGAGSVAQALEAAKSAEEPVQSRIAALQAAVPVEQQIKELQQERKSLAEAGPRDKHFSQGAWLAFLGTAFAIEGPLNTYARAGKLFPGPHLYAGAGLVVLWALAASCVPAMQKGSETARTVHIGANLAGLGLFGWQVVSGIPILLKVVELTKWP